MICDHIAAHPDDFKGFVEDEDVAAYVAKVRKVGEFLDQHALNAIAVIYNTRIVVHHDTDAAHDVVHEPPKEDGADDESGDENKDKGGKDKDEASKGLELSLGTPQRLLRLAYSPGEHYDLVVPTAKEHEYAKDRGVWKSFLAERQAQERGDRRKALAVKRAQAKEQSELNKALHQVERSKRHRHKGSAGASAVTAKAKTATGGMSPTHGSDQDEGKDDEEESVGSHGESTGQNDGPDHDAGRGDSHGKHQVGDSTAARASASASLGNADDDGGGCACGGDTAAADKANGAATAALEALLAESKAAIEEHKAIMAENKALLAELRLEMAHLRKRKRDDNEAVDDAQPTTAAVTGDGTSVSKRARRGSVGSCEDREAKGDDEEKLVCRRKRCNSIVHEPKPATHELIRKFARRLVPPQDEEGKEAFAERGGYAPREINGLWLRFVESKRKQTPRRDHHPRMACLRLKNMCRDGMRLGLGLVFDLHPETRVRRYRRLEEGVMEASGGTHRQ